MENEAKLNTIYCVPREDRKHERDTPDIDNATASTNRTAPYLRIDVHYHTRIFVGVCFLSRHTHTPTHARIAIASDG